MFNNITAFCKIIKPYRLMLIKVHVLDAYRKCTVTGLPLFFTSKIRDFAPSSCFYIHFYALTSFTTDGIFKPLR